MVCQSASNHCFCEVERCDSSDSQKFYIYHLGEDNIKIEDYSEESKVEGTYLTVTINGGPSGEKCNPQEKIYVRFRVFLQCPSDIAKTEILSNDLLQAAFSRTDLFDIRFNEKREIPSKVDEKMKKQQYKLCDFSKLHFFYIVDTHESISNGIEIRKDSRMLENEHWVDYAPKSNIANVNYIAHHWKKKNEKGETIPCFSLFFSTIYPMLSVIRLVAYFSVIIILGWLGSMLSFSCEDFLKNISEWKKWIKPIIVILILVGLFIYIVISNFNMYAIKLRRKL